MIERGATTVPTLRVVVAGILALAASGWLAASDVRAQPARTLRDPSAFDGIADRARRSALLFTEAGKVFRHPRCANCHAAGDRPLQGERGALHQPPVSRGADGTGPPGLRCAACHTDANYDAVRVPGVVGWQQAPAAMALQGRSLAEVCAQIKDEDRNGARTLDDIVKHTATDPLVVWAWTPGAGREPAPGTHATFLALVKAWVATGAVCPAGGVHR
jgi:hypothetical protein